MHLEQVQLDVEDIDEAPAPAPAAAPVAEGAGALGEAEADEDGGAELDEEEAADAAATAPIARVVSRHPFAFAAASLLGIAACHCMDRLRTELQLRPELGPSPAAALQRVLAEEGWAGLLRGLAPAALEAVLKVLVRIYAQHVFEQLWRRHVAPPPPGQPVRKLGPRAQLCSSVFVGAFEALLLMNPLEYLKTQQMTAPAADASLRAVLHAAAVQQPPIVLYTGVAATGARQVLNHVLWFPVWQLLGTRLAPLRLPPPLHNVLTSVATGLAITAANHPLELLCTAAHAHGQERTLLQLTRQLATSGLRPAWAGVQWRLAAMPVAQLVSLVLYQSVFKSLLTIVARV